MRFDTALDKLRADRSLKMRRKHWEPDGWYVREVDLYADKEFRLVHQPGSVGVFEPFFVWYVVAEGEAKLVAWQPQKDDVLAKDWTVFS